jgi:hypothetical protein
MEKDVAILVANMALDAYRVPAAQGMKGAERRIIELEATAPGGGRLVRDVRVWVVRFQAGMTWTELAVDESTGTVVRVERSRTA